MAPEKKEGPQSIMFFQMRHGIYVALLFFKKKERLSMMYTKIIIIF